MKGFQKSVSYLQIDLLKDRLTDKVIHRGAPLLKTKHNNAKVGKTELQFREGQIYRRTDIARTDLQKDKYTEGQIYRRTDIQKDRYTEGQIYRRTEIQKDRNTRKTYRRTEIP